LDCHGHTIGFLFYWLQYRGYLMHNLFVLLLAAVLPGSEDGGYTVGRGWEARLGAAAAHHAQQK
jgi:hypothetical protein